MARRGNSISYPKQGGDASTSGNAHGHEDDPSVRPRKIVKKSIVAQKDNDPLGPVRRKRNAPVPDIPPTHDNTEAAETSPAEPPAKRQARSDIRHKNGQLSTALAPPPEAIEDQPGFAGSIYDEKPHRTSRSLPPADTSPPDNRQHIQEYNAGIKNQPSTSTNSAAGSAIVRAKSPQTPSSSATSGPRTQEDARMGEPLSKAHPRPVLRFISDQRALEHSAQVWTTGKSSASITENGDLVIKYRHQIGLPGNPHPAIFHICLPSGENGSWKSFGINAEILSQCSYLINQIVKQFGFVALEDGYIHLSKVSEDVLEACLSYLEGGELLIKLPAPPLSDEFKRTLLEYTHVAHVFNVPILMKAAMHAFCTAYHRRAKDFAVNEAIRRLLVETTFEGNPSRRYLASTAPECIIPGMICRNGLPYEKADIDRVCTIEYDQWHRMWSGEGKKFPRYPLSEKFVLQQQQEEEEEEEESLK